jgi:chromosome segregation ATPase
MACVIEPCRSVENHTGETSPKRMRRAGMEDLIFAGTATRHTRATSAKSLFF